MFLQFTILTPTYNRAHTLEHVYTCLEAQTLRDFEWLIVDDGSSDDTQTLVKSWLQTSPFAIRYIKQANGGKHTALNRGIREARGYFTVILDSDDVIRANCLEHFLYHWHTIPEAQREHYAGVTGLCIDQDGNLLGGKFPVNTFDSNAVEITYVHRLADDRYGMQRTDVMRQFPFPVFEGEKFLTESVVWNRIARHYKNRYVNEVLCVKEYRADGLTRSVAKHLSNNPKGSSLYYGELLTAPEPLAFKIRVGIYSYYVRYALHAKLHPLSFTQFSKKPLFASLGWLLGTFLYLRDRLSPMTKGLEVG
jgi:glycosyltransferase involved in cell wall biosynthesis